MTNMATRQAGDLDPDFNGGMVNLSHLGFSPVFMNEIRPTPDGGVLVTARGLREGRFISKFTRQGKLDTAFRENGCFAISPQQRLLVAADGSFYLVDKLSGARIFVEKFYADGQRDERYAEKGTAILDFGKAGVKLLIDSRDSHHVPDLSSTVLAALDDGSLYIVSAGYWGGLDGFRTVLARLDENGLHDTQYGDNGFFVFNRPGDKFTLPTSVQVQKFAGQPASLLLNVSETRPTFEWQPGYNFLLYRLTRAGQVDETFGEQGVITVHQGQGLDFDFFVDEQQTFKTLHRHNYRSLELKGWTADGKQDTSFEAWSISMPPETNIGLGLKSYGAGEHYRVVHFGSVYGTSPEKRDVFRYLSNGQGDPAFGKQGAATLEVRTSGWLMNVKLEVVPGTHDLFFTAEDDVFRLKGS
ncbi:hypothetical protein [Pseudomonas sp. URMO17WK12:I11]|uniref:hypothetical protein n=1 Tax=Pseudomonas sp. URMO17WK12:I11 TaxID=1283291 RepID=UPI00119DB880|nr:hypothetical protein [Pseudomonas sp. URMO17WK12:I11]